MVGTHSSGRTDLAEVGEVVGRDGQEVDHVHALPAVGQGLAPPGGLLGALLYVYIWITCEWIACYDRSSAIHDMHGTTRTSFPSM